MLNKIGAAGKQLVESALAIVGIRTVEEPLHSVEPLVGGVEIRRYGPRIAAETVVNSTEVMARNTGFRRLATYIFGANQRDAAIAMTAPVAQSTDGGGWTIRFFLPAQWTMQTLPAPNDERVRLVTVPAETVAVSRFTGDRGPTAVAMRTARLLETLRSAGVEPHGEPTAWFYDPPWTIPCRRRNEIAIPIQD